MQNMQNGRKCKKEMEIHVKRFRQTQQVFDQVHTRIRTHLLQWNKEVEQMNQVLSKLAPPRVN